MIFWICLIARLSDSRSDWFPKRDERVRDKPSPQRVSGQNAVKRALGCEKTHLEDLMEIPLIVTPQTHLQIQVCSCMLGLNRQSEIGSRIGWGQREKETSTDDPRKTKTLPCNRQENGIKKDMTISGRTSHHITSHHITSHHITSHHITSHHLA